MPIMRARYWRAPARTATPSLPSLSDFHAAEVFLVGASAAWSPLSTQNFVTNTMSRALGPRHSHPALHADRSCGCHADSSTVNAPCSGASITCICGRVLLYSLVRIRQLNFL